MKRLSMTIFLLAIVLALPTQADFIQCDGNCAGTAAGDVMNGSDGNDNMDGLAGNDVMFGGAGLDDIDGGEGDDVIFGGDGQDHIHGGPGNDTIIPGTCEGINLPSASGDDGNDKIIILAGETVNCRLVEGGDGFDVVNLLGFGPYTADYPFGQPEPIAINSYLVIQDPVGDGYIFVRVEDGLNNVERINGLPSPNVTVLDSAAFNTFRNENCTGIF